ncbi:protein DBF4 homolog A [Cololabis saira]|uniref:protein DBF4 homolog A n=1 Tax=Cololabis saira TaxID=129043 RepID=UPI002AD312F9|nr:protein DBF4 homolog A [Cololabis saira]
MNENTMKTKRFSKRPGPNWQGNAANKGEKKPVSQAKQTQVSSHAQVRPFAGKVFFLDLPSNRKAETLESDIKELGGTIEKFFSKEIKYLVSNKREARCVHGLRKDSPAPSADSGPSSPHPCSNPLNHGESIKSRSLNQAETFVTSRGKSLVEKVVKEQGRVQMDRMLSNALEWGVKILYIDDLLAYVQKKKKGFQSQVLMTAAPKKSVKIESAAKQRSQKCKVGRLTKPFIKVEDSSKHYRPIYLTMANMPEFNLSSIAPGTPFCLEDKEPPGTKPKRGVKAPASEEKAQSRKRNRDKKRGGYCECCMIKYNNLTMHVRSERHKAFSKSDEYSVLDQLVSTLQCNFTHLKAEVKRPKCSVSSVFVTTGPCGKTDLKRDGDLSESVKVEQHGTVDGSKGSYPGQNTKTGSVPCSPPHIHAKFNWMNSYTYSHRSKHKSSAPKRTSSHNSLLTSCTQKSEQAQIPQLKSETTPSAGETVLPFPSRVTQVDLVDQKLQKDTSSSAPHVHNTNVSSEVTDRVNAMTHEQENIKKDTSHSETVQEGNAFSDKGTGNDLSEKQEGSFSPVRKIRRRIKVHKHKRRKIDTNIKGDDVPDYSILRLLEIFQSSDDMDVEFHGFVE